MARGYVLSESDLAALRRLADDARRPPPARPPFPHDRDDYLTPETYVVRVPAQGIPARAAGAVTTGTGTDATSAAGTVAGRPCEVYKVVGGTLNPVGKTVRVHNLSAAAVAGPSFTLATRDKFGTWFVLPGGAAGCGTEVRLKRVCPRYDDAGAFAGVTNEFGVWDPAACAWAATWCEDDPQGCCANDPDTGTGTGTTPPPVPADCCPSGLPTYMPVTVSWQGGTVSGTATLNGFSGGQPVWDVSFGPAPGQPGAPNPVPLWGGGLLTCGTCVGEATPRWLLSGLTARYNHPSPAPFGPQWYDLFGSCNVDQGSGVSYGTGVAATLSADCDAPCLRFLLTPHPSNPVTQQPVLLTIGQGCPAGTGTGTGTGGSANIYSVGLGTVTSSAIGTAALPVSWDAGEVVVLSLAWRGEGAPSSVLLDGTPMVLTGEAWNGLTGAAKQELVVYVSDPASSSGAGLGSITVSMSGGTPSVMLLAAEAVGGLPAGEADPGDGSDTGSSTAVSVSGSLSAGDGYIHSCALLSHATGGAEAGTWAAPTGDGQTESVADGGLTLYLRTGERVATAAGGYTAAMDALGDAHDWLAVLVPLY